MSTRAAARPGMAKFPALDGFRLAAAVLVVTIHTSPLASVSPAGGFLADAGAGAAGGAVFS